MIDIKTGKIMRAETINRKGEIDDLLLKVIPELAVKLSEAKALPKTESSAPAEETTKKNSKNSKRKWLIAGISVVVVGAAIPVAYFVFFKKADASDDGDNTVLH